MFLPFLFTGQLGYLWMAVSLDNFCSLFVDHSAKKAYGMSSGATEGFEPEPRTKGASDRCYPESDAVSLQKKPGKRRISAIDGSTGLTEA